jgi:hypothetical protein
MVTVTLQFSVFLMVTITLKCSASYGHCLTAGFIVPNSHYFFEFFSSLCPLSYCSVNCSSWLLSLWCFRLLIVTVTLQFLVFLIVTVTLKCSGSYGYCYNSLLCVPNSHCHFELFRSLWSLSHCSVQYSSWTRSLWSVQLVMVTVTLQCSVFLMVSVIFKCSLLYGPCHTAVFSVPNSHCHFEIFIFLWSLSLQCSFFLIVTVTLNCSSPYAHCHHAVFSILYSYWHFGVFSSLRSLSPCSFLYSSFLLSFWSFQLLIITVTLQCSLFLIVTVTFKFSGPYVHCHCSVHCS